MVNWIKLPSGQFIGPSLLLDCEWSIQVNGGEDLAPGTVAVGELRFKFIADGASVAQGDKIQLYRGPQATRKLVATCICDKPTYSSLMRGGDTYQVYEVTAYDMASMTEVDLSDWLRGQQSAFPMTMTAFANAVAEQCGLSVAGELPRNGDYQIRAFYSDGMTARQLLSWVAEATCTFCTANPDGDLIFRWYEENAVTGVFPDEGTHWSALDLSNYLYSQANQRLWTYGQDGVAYKQGGLSYSDYATAPIEKVQIRQTDNDVGVVYPADETGENALIISGNLLLTTDTDANLRPVAQAIYEAVQHLSYVPARVELFEDGTVFSPGDIITVTDPLGNSIMTYVMDMTVSASGVTIESSGNPSRTSSTAVNQQIGSNLEGKVLEISATVDGLNIKAGELDGKYTELEQTVNSITLSAESDGNSSKLTLSANGIELSSANITFDGMVTFTDLSTSGRTSINGGNIQTGTLGSPNGNTQYNLTDGWLRTGRDGSTRVEMNDTGIRWYYQNYLTGVLYSQYGKTYIGDNSQFTFLGWFNSATPNFDWNTGGPTGSFVGIAIRQEGIIHCNATKFEIPGRIECASLAVNGREI